MSDLNEQLHAAVGKLIKAKGRGRAEQNYKAVVEAYDAARRTSAAAPAPVAAMDAAAIADVILHLIHHEFVLNYYDKGEDDGFASDEHERAYLVQEINTALAAVPAAAPVVQPLGDLHDAIMRIKCDVTNCTLTDDVAEMSYKQGHRDARHAAAALSASAVQAEPVVEWVNDEQGFQLLCDIALHEGTKLYTTPQPHSDAWDASSTAEAKDAARYRWLREHTVLARNRFAPSTWRSGAMLDRIIDAARAAALRAKQAGEGA